MKYDMNDWRQLYLHLMCMTEGDTSPFYYVDQEAGGDQYRIFLYRSAIPRDFGYLWDLEARGIMFEMVNGEPVRVACRTPLKFFNKGEHPNFPFSPVDEPDNVDALMDKADGSLMSTYITSSGELRLKSKGSLSSDHAIAAMEWLNRPAQAQFRDLLKYYSSMGGNNWTINMEWVSPDPLFRIVVKYSHPHLKIHGVRNNSTGGSLSWGMMAEYMGDYLVERYPNHMAHDLANILDEMQDAEGFVVHSRDGQVIKLKCPWYLARHRCIDIVRNPLAFAELVLKGESDDVKELMSYLREEMDKIEYAVTRYVNKSFKTVTAYWQANKDLTRKYYAIKGREELNGVDFSLAMMYYSNGVEPKWNDFYLKQLKKIDWGFDND